VERFDSMMRILRYFVIFVAGVVIAIGGLILEGGTLENIFAIKEVPVVDFASLQRKPTPNQYLLCPENLCKTETDGAAPTFDTTAERLQALWELMIAEEPRVQEAGRDLAMMQVDYVQRSKLLRFPDLITVRFIPVDDMRSTLAIYSRSIYGSGDMGVNRARVEDWLAKLKARVAQPAS
jgi:uncharacterized protein (DUF1499 family)